GSSTAETLGNDVGATIANSVAGATGSANGSAGSTGSAGRSWLVTVTGFRGNALGASVGEEPVWTGSGFAAQSGGGITPPVTPGSSGGASP
ncbi:MAG TPA: hypothetical protein VKT19_03755, partial [Steroidobacteraceae bacterium]|nr:hypothetical protein [Steroidobacteraceae bacterium]